MNKVKIIISIVLCIVLSLNGVIVVSASDNSEEHYIRFVNAEYVRHRTVSNRHYTLHIRLDMMNFIDETFTGEFFVTGDSEYRQEITGDISTDIFWNSKKDGYSYSFTFRVNWKNGYTQEDYMYNLELNDKLGLLRGYTNAEDTISAQLGGCEFVATPNSINAFSISQKVNSISFDESLYDECLKYSVAVYDKNASSLFDIPNELLNSLRQYEYQGIVGNYFHDDRDDNVSYAIAHKKTDTGQKCMIVIRGTDGVEWEGNMKICPPDSDGNYDKYTFTDGDDTHDNFLNAALDLKDTIKEYLDIFEINNEDTTIVITGHSRGGAVSNLTAKELTDDTEVLSKVTAYTFATPNVAPFEKYPYMERYTNIYNFCKMDDFIPGLPLTNEGWNYWKYGICLLYTSPSPRDYAASRMPSSA